jgi:hypothetical protein
MRTAGVAVGVVHDERAGPGFFKIAPVQDLPVEFGVLRAAHAQRDGLACGVGQDQIVEAGEAADIDDRVGAERERAHRTLAGVHRRIQQTPRFVDI